MKADLRFLYFLFPLFLFLACHSEKASEEKASTSSDSVKEESDTSDIPLDSGKADTGKAAVGRSPKDSVSEAFIRLVKHLESSGFICDRRRNVEQEAFKREGHRFYSFPFEASVQMMGGAEGRLDRELMSQVERISVHFHIDASVNEEDSGPYHPDGVIEEWHFPSADLAERATQHMARKESAIYFNRGAYVARLNQRLYLFHSRASQFYTHLKQLWAWFAEKEGAKRPLSSKQRSMY